MACPSSTMSGIPANDMEARGLLKPSFGIYSVTFCRILSLNTVTRFKSGQTVLLIGKLKCYWLSRVQLFCDPLQWRLPGSSVHGILQAKNTGVGSHSLLQGIFLDSGIKPGSPALQTDSLPSEPPGGKELGRFFSDTPREGCTFSFAQPCTLVSLPPPVSGCLTHWLPLYILLCQQHCIYKAWQSSHQILYKKCLMSTSQMEGSVFS